MDDEGSKIVADFGKFAERMGWWIQHINELDDKGLPIESILLQVLLLEEILRQSTKALAYVLPGIGLKDPRTFGQLVSVYGQLRPEKETLVKELDQLAKYRNGFVHSLFIKDQDELARPLSKELRSKAIKDVAYEVLGDVKDVLMGEWTVRHNQA